jgi:hypothetical protein
MMKLLPGVSVAAHSRWSSFARRLVPWACPLDADRRQCFGPNTDTLSTYGSRSSERLLAGHSDLDGISWPKRFRIRQSPKRRLQVCSSRRHSERKCPMPRFFFPHS